jgi:hypothetical protein
MLLYGDVAMSYTPATLKCTAVGVGGGPSTFSYSTADAHTDVDAAGYFSDGADYGMKAGDVMDVVSTSSGTTRHRVASATTIDAAVLA